MKRAPSEDLFRLIRSLSKGEKRNFKLLAGLLASEKDKKYLGLFDLIDRQEVYDEAKVLKLLHHLYGGQLAVGKHYLYRLILKSLVYFSSNPSNDLSNIVEQVKVLAEKDLYSQASKLLRKGVAESEAIEDFNTQYCLLGIQSDILLRTQNEKRLADRIAELERDRAQLLDKMANLDAYRNLSHRAFLLLQTRQVANSAVDQAALAALQREPLAADISQAQSARARIEYLSLHRKFCSFAGDLEGAIDFSQQLLALYDALPLLKEESIRLYFAELGNICTYLLRLGHLQEAFSKMDDFRQFRIDYPRARLDFFQLYYVIVLASSIHIGEPERGIELEEEIEREWSAIDGKIPKGHEMWLRYLLAYSHFMNGNPKLALRWINRLLKEPKTEVRVDIQASVRILNLLVHFELGNFTLIESEILSTKRFLEKYEQLHDFERQVLKCIKSLALAADSPQQQSAFASWEQRMMELEQQDSEKASRILNFAEWLKSRIENRTMASLRKENLNASSQNGILPH